MIGGFAADRLTVDEYPVTETDPLTQMSGFPVDFDPARGNPLFDLPPGTIGKRCQMLLQLRAVVLVQFTGAPSMRRDWKRHHLGTHELVWWFLVGCFTADIRSGCIGHDCFAERLDADSRLQRLHVS